MRLQGARPQAVLFDCDGVLVDSEPITIKLLRDDLANYGLDLPLDQVMSLFVGGTIRDDAQKARNLGAALPANWVDQFYERAFAALSQEVEPVPGAVDLLHRLLEQDVKIAVGSNGPRRKMEITLGRTGMADILMPHVYSAHDLPRPKPAPDVYQHAARQLGISSESCVVVEDSETGAQAAIAAGMRCIGFAAEGQGPLLAPLCDAIAHDMSQVGRLLGI